MPTHTYIHYDLHASYSTLHTHTSTRSTRRALSCSLTVYCLPGPQHSPVAVCCLLLPLLLPWSSSSVTEAQQPQDPPGPTQRRSVSAAYPAAAARFREGPVSSRVPSPKKGLSRRSTSVCRQGPPLACAWSAWVVYFAHRGPKPPSSPTTSLVCQPHPLMDEQAEVRERLLASSEGMLAAWARALRLTHRLVGHACLRET